MLHPLALERAASISHVDEPDIGAVIPQSTGVLSLESLAGARYRWRDVFSAGLAKLHDI